MPDQFDIPDDVHKKIKGAWMAAIVSGVMTLGVTLVALSGKSMLGFGALNLLDVVLIFGLAYGIYRKSRACAVVMFAYFAISKIMLISADGPGQRHRLRHDLLVLLRPRRAGHVRVPLAAQGAGRRLSTGRRCSTAPAA